MANRKITQFTALTAGTQTPTMVLPIVDPTLGNTAAANKKVTLNNLFFDLGLNTTDKGIAQTGVATVSAPSVSTALQMKWYYDTTLQTPMISLAGGAYQDWLSTAISIPTSTFAGLPPSPGKVKEYLLTDTNKSIWAYNTNANQWVSQNGQVYNVKDFGAKGDNVTDDRASIQAAIDAASASGGATVLVPPGDYKILAAGGGYGLLIRSNIILSGADAGGTRIRFTGAFTDSMMRGFSRDDNNPSNYEVAIIQNLTLYSGSNVGIYVLDLTGFRNSTVRNITWDGGGLANGCIGLVLADTNPSATSSKSCFFNTISQLSLQNLDTGIKVKSVNGNCSVNEITSGNAFSKYGLDLTGSSFQIGIVFDSFYFAGSGAGSQAIKSDTIPLNTNFRNCYFEGFVVAITENIEGASSYATAPATFNGVQAPVQTLNSFEGYAPLIVGDYDYQFVASGMALSLTGDGIRVRFAPGVAYNTYRYLQTAVQDITPTNTGAPHTEYGVVNNLARNDTNRIQLKITTTSDDLILGSVAVDASGHATSITADLRQLYALPSFRTVNIGAASQRTGQIVLYNATNSNTLTLQSGVSAASRVYTLPTNFGAAGAVLTDAAGNGTLSWAVPTGTIAGSIGANQVAFGLSANTIKGQSTFTFDGSNLIVPSTVQGGQGIFSSYVASTNGLWLSSASSARTQAQFCGGDSGGNWNTVSGLTQAHLLRVSFAPTAGSATLVGTVVAPTFNTTGAFTGTASGFRVSPYLQSTTGLSAPILLIDVGTNTAANALGTHTTKWGVDSNGRQVNYITSTGAGAALLGANCPAGTLAAPFEWINVTLSDGSLGYIPAWK